MTKYNVVIYRPCYFKVSDIIADTPEEAIEEAVGLTNEQGLASWMVDYAEVDEDFEPTLIVVTDADAEERTEVLVVPTPNANFKQELSSLLKKYDATIAVSFSPCSVTSLFGAPPKIIYITDGKGNTLVESSKYSMCYTDLGE
jgi:hypothetical protein